MKIVCTKSDVSEILKVEYAKLFGVIPTGYHIDVNASYDEFEVELIKDEIKEEEK